MLRFTLFHQLARRTAIGFTGTSIATVSALTIYTKTEYGLGFKREWTFWQSVAPILFDYYWNAWPTSPKVRLNHILMDAMGNNYISLQTEEDRKELLQKLHKRNAPKIFKVMIELGGLYIKLGQVLSVTALPIPEEYRVHFRTLQSNAPVHQDFETVVKPTLEKELGASLHDLFESFSTIPVGAASIGQAHRAILKETKEEVIVKVQYPNARWEIPADIQCIGDFLKFCVWFGLVDKHASNLSFEEFSRQFIAELDYCQEVENLQQVYESSLDPKGPYVKRGVIIPRVFKDFCTEQIITMTYLPGPKFEEEAKQQLELLGIDTKKGMRAIVSEGHEKNIDNHRSSSDNIILAASPRLSLTRKLSSSKFIGNTISVDILLSLARFAHRIVLWSTAIVAKSIQAASYFSNVPFEWQEWAIKRQTMILQAARLNWTHEAVYSLLDIHGYQIFCQGLFNADPHPGNIILVMEEDVVAKHKPKIGLIDYGQCKRLTPIERVKIAKLILSVADKESDDVIANNFRSLGIKTKNDSTKFLAEFGRLMFDSFDMKHLDKSWHMELHKEDKVLYFPRELSMVYRTSLLLRGLAMSLQINPSVGKEWRHYAQLVIDQHSQVLKE